MNEWVPGRKGREKIEVVSIFNPSLYTNTTDFTKGKLFLHTLKYFKDSYQPYI